MAWPAAAGSCHAAMRARVLAGSRVAGITSPLCAPCTGHAVCRPGCLAALFKGTDIYITMCLIQLAFK